MLRKQPVFGELAKLDNATKTENVFAKIVQSTRCNSTNWPKHGKTNC
jgi:hypothetical protein